VYSSTDPLHFLYAIILNEVYDHETDLDDGRFKNYTRDEQPNRIDLNLNGPSPIPINVERWLDWIAQHSSAPWNLSVQMNHISDGIAIFSFADTTTAVMFKLVFG
jgi:hypothetical protein